MKRKEPVNITDLASSYLQNLAKRYGFFVLKKSFRPFCCFTVRTNGQSNFTQVCIVASHGTFKRTRQVVSIYIYISHKLGYLVSSAHTCISFLV